MKIMSGTLIDFLRFIWIHAELFQHCFFRSPDLILNHSGKHKTIFFTSTSEEIKIILITQNISTKRVCNTSHILCHLWQLKNKIIFSRTQLNKLEMNEQNRNFNRTSNTKFYVYWYYHYFWKFVWENITIIDYIRFLSIEPIG